MSVQFPARASRSLAARRQRLAAWIQSVGILCTVLPKGQLSRAHSLYHRPWRIWDVGSVVAALGRVVHNLARCQGQSMPR